MSAATRVAAFLGAYFAANAINAFMPLWFADRGLSASDIGQILGAAAFLRVLAGPGWGNVADRIGRRRPVLLFAAFTAAGLGLSYAAATGFVPLLLIAAAQGIASSAINPLADSLALALAREGRLEYGPVRAVGSATFMLATAAVGWLLNRAGSWLVPWLLATGYGASAILSAFLPEAATPPAAPQAFAGLMLFRNPAFRLVVSCTALIQGAHAAYYGFAALFWRAQGLSDTVIGLLIAEGIVAEILLFARGRRLVERLGPAGLTACAASASVVRWTITAFAPPLPILALVQFVHAATFAMQHLSAMMVLNRFVPTERAATAQALHSALGYGAPTGLMMMLSGWLYARYGGMVFLAMAVVSGAALLLIAPLTRLTVRPPGTLPTTALSG
ncbi:MAG: transporter, family, 3-phenylpropionic acid transporter [Acetobacteraceae bacterium]|nr:transporter, family, 3-phenylpropionic acid transporter [Acetobacteraceae bacterium]